MLGIIGAMDEEVAMIYRWRQELPWTFIKESWRGKR